MLIKDLTRWKKEGWRVILLSASRTRASRLASDLREYDLKAFCPDPPVGEEEGGALGSGQGGVPGSSQSGVLGSSQSGALGSGQGGTTGQPGGGPSRPESAIQVQPGQILVTHGNLHRGFEYP